MTWRLAGVAALLLVPSIALGEMVGEVRAAHPPAVDAAPPGLHALDRLGEIRQRIQAVLVYPALARRQRMEGETLVRFAIAADGAASGIKVHRSSGAPLLDRAAARAVNDAAPLPWVYGLLEVPVRFDLESRR